MTITTAFEHLQYLLVNAFRTKFGSPRTVHHFVHLSVGLMIVSGNGESGIFQTVAAKNVMMAAFTAILFIVLPTIN